MKRVFLGVVVASTCVLSACGTNTKQQDAYLEQMNQENQRLLASYVWNIERVLQPKPEQAQFSFEQDHTLPAAPAEIRPFEILFDHDRLSVQGLCNHLAGSYQIEGSHISIGPMISTRKFCADEQLMQVEAFVGQVLPAADEWQIVGVESTNLAQSRPSLTLSFINGMQWHLQGTPTLETRYGHKPVTEFLQVDPKPYQCSNGQGECFKVRKLEYDDKGIRTTVGPWQLIQRAQLLGYEPAPDYMNTIRVNRFMAQDNDRYYPIYEYDMTVEQQPIR